MFCFNGCLKCGKIKEEKNFIFNKKVKERTGGKWRVSIEKESGVNKEMD